MIIGFIIWSLVALVFLGIGIRGLKAKDAVGFWTTAKPPVVTDVSRYNRAVSMIWIVASIVLEIIGMPFLFQEQNSPIFVVVVVCAIALVIGMMIAFVKIEAKYKK